MDLEGINPEDLPEELREKLQELGRELSEHMGEDSSIKNPVDEDTTARHLRALHSLAHSGSPEDVPEDERGATIPLAVIPDQDAKLTVEENVGEDGDLPELDRSTAALGSTGASFLGSYLHQNYGTPEVANS